MVVHLFSPDGRYDDALPAQLRHAAGQGRARAHSRAWATCSVFGSGDYAMRVWLDPDKVAARDLTASDVVARHPRAERAGRRRRDRPAAGQPRRCRLRAADQRPGPPGHRRRSSARSSSRPAPNGEKTSAQGRRPHRTGRRQLRAALAARTTRPPSRFRIFQSPGVNALAALATTCARRWRS